MLVMRSIIQPQTPSSGNMNAHKLAEVLFRYFQTSDCEILNYKFNMWCSGDLGDDEATVEEMEENLRRECLSLAGSLLKECQ